MVVFEMEQWKAPRVLQLLIILMLHTSFVPKPKHLDLDFVELFAGRAAVSTALREEGTNGSSHDICISPMLDLTTTAGFLFLGLTNNISFLMVKRTMVHAR